MNKTNLLRVADAIEKHEYKVGYNQELYVGVSGELPDRSGHGCGTTGCIAGWVHMVMEDESDLTVETFVDAKKCARFLGIDEFERHRLFHASARPSSIDWKDSPTSAQAVRTLRYAAEHGVIDWDAANPPEAS